MDNKNQIPFPEVVVLPTLEKIERAARFIGSFFCMHQLSKISDHEFNHPLDEPLELPLLWTKEG
jgi:hypothetical protein